MYTVIAELLDANLKDPLNWIWNIVAERIRTSPVVPYLLNMQLSTTRFADIQQLNSALVEHSDHIRIKTCPERFDPLRYQGIKTSFQAADASFTGFRSKRSGPRTCPGLSLAASEEYFLLLTRWLKRDLWVNVPLHSGRTEPLRFEDMKHPDSVLPKSLGNTPNIEINVIPSLSVIF